MAVAGGFIEELRVMKGEQLPPPSLLRVIVTSDSRSGVECHAQLNTSRSFGITSR